MATVPTQNRELRGTKNQKAPSRGRRKRGAGDDKHSRPAWVYFNPDEYDIIERAANIERRSMSSFIADSALTKAEEILRIYNRGRQGR